MTAAPKLKLFLLRYASVIGCAEHGPNGRDMKDDCETCKAVLEMRSWRRRGKFGVVDANILRLFLEATS